MEPLTLVKRIKSILEDKKAEHVRALDLTNASQSLDYFVIATANSQPHLQALEREVRDGLEAFGVKPRVVEGPSPRWVLLDYGPVILHLMSEEARDYYDLEGFWIDATAI